MRPQWMAGLGGESARVRLLGMAVLCLLTGLVVLSICRSTLSALESRLDWTDETTSLLYVIPLSLVVAVIGYTLIRVGDRMALSCFLVMVLCRTIVQITDIADIQSGPLRDTRIAASGVANILVVVVIYRLVRMLLDTEEQRKQLVLQRLAESTSHRIGTNFLEGLVAATVEILNVRLAFISEVDAETQSETILSSAAATGRDVPAALKSGSELTPDWSAQWQGDKGESLYRIDLTDQDGLSVGGLGLVCAESDHISPGQQSSLRIFAARASAEILRLQADRRSSDMEARMLHVQKLEGLGVLAGGIAHDFNNLLQAIGGYAALTDRLLPESSEAREANDQIHGIVRTGGSMCERLLAYAGRAVRADAVCDINEIAQETAKIVQAARTDCRVTLHLSSQPLRVWGDVAQLTQVVINLLTNAADAVQGRNGRIELRTAAGGAGSHMARGLQLTEDGDHAIIEVTDNGCGIDDHAVAKIFDPFYSTKGTGRGIGLAVVAGIVRDHHGDIAVRNHEDDRTTFRIAFPITDRVAEPAAKQARRPPAGLDSRSVLLVDDDDAVRTATRLLLEAAGIAVTTATSGQEAISQLEADCPFDCILMDQTMPGLSGVETYQRLRGKGVTTPVILMSGFAAVDIDVQTPGVTFLSKPYVTQDLLSAMSTAIEAGLAPATPRPLAG